ncbi:MAG: hypothetical protein NXI04_17515 [Planctomycetaceae bacterium]|nr:hypothetical protein [Planctomycetaceae bacterium]
MYLMGGVTSGFLLAYFVSSEQLNSWGELGAAAILGLLCVGFGVLHWKTMAAMAKAVERLAKSNEKTAADFREDHRRLMEQLVEGLISEQGE